jgi:hypothetical protein
MNVFFLIFENVHQLKMVVRTGIDEWSIVSPEYAGDLHFEIRQSSIFAPFPIHQLPHSILNIHEWERTIEGLDKILVYKY